MLTTLAIINMAIAAALINETVDEQGVQQSTEVVAMAETTDISDDLTTISPDSDK